MPLDHFDPDERCQSRNTAEESQIIGSDDGARVRGERMGVGVIGSLVGLGWDVMLFRLMLEPVAPGWMVLFAALAVGAVVHDGGGGAELSRGIALTSGGEQDADQQ